MNRRFFLKGALAVTALAILPAPDLHAYPTLYGDGVHDDTEALQALLDLKPYVCEGSLIKGQTEAHISAGKYKTSKTLLVCEDGALIEGCSIEYTGEDHIIHFIGDTKSVVMNCNFTAVRGGAFKFDQKALPPMMYDGIFKS